MPFIGNQPTSGRFLELDSLTASATDDYTLQLNGANFSPESVNNLLVSINGVIQGSSTMSLNGAVLTVGATLSSSDTIDFVRVFGNVGTVSTPTDGSVTANKIGTGAITNAKIADNAGIAGSKLGTDAVLQVKQGILRTTWSQTSGTTTWDDTPLSVVITPQSTNSKILITGMICFSLGGTQNHGGFKVVRNGQDFLLNTSSNTNRQLGHIHYYTDNAFDSNYQIQNGALNLLDEPSSTSELTYKLQARTKHNAPYTMQLNQVTSDSDNAYNGFTVSTLTAMEIGG